VLPPPVAPPDASERTHLVPSKLGMMGIKEKNKSTLESTAHLFHFFSSRVLPEGKGKNIGNFKNFQIFSPVPQQCHYILIFNRVIISLSNCYLFLPNYFFYPSVKFFFISLP